MPLYTTQYVKELLSLIEKTKRQSKKLTIEYTNDALLNTLRHLQQKGFVTGLEMVWRIFFKAIH